MLCAEKKPDQRSDSFQDKINARLLLHLEHPEYHNAHRRRGKNQNYRMYLFALIFRRDSGKNAAIITRDIQLNCENPSALILVKSRLGSMTAQPTVSTAERISPTTTGRMPHRAP